MQVSILIPTYNRPEQLAEALASLRHQDLNNIGEIIISDDSQVVAMREANQRTIGTSGLAHLIRYYANTPARGNYPNQWFLGTLAQFPLCLLLHDDDVLRPYGLDRLVSWACMDLQADPEIAVWFGRNLIMNEEGVVDYVASHENTVKYGKDREDCVKPVWEWCLMHSLPPNCMLMRTEVYQEHMRGDRDGNVGDWAMHVRMANAGFHGRFIATDVFKYRIQTQSVTNSGRQADAHLYYEHALELQVPADAEWRKRLMLDKIDVAVATTRYLREGERLRAWKCYLSQNWKWQRRISARGLATLGMLMLPTIAWSWALTAI